MLISPHTAEFHAERRAPATFVQPTSNQVCSGIRRRALQATRSAARVDVQDERDLRATYVPLTPLVNNNSIKAKKAMRLPCPERLHHAIADSGLADVTASWNGNNDFLSERTAKELQASENIPPIFEEGETGILPDFRNWEDAGQILLRGLERPTRIAVVSGGRTHGIFFLHSTGSEEAMIPSSENRQQSRQRLSFLSWGARETTTLVENLCDPVALCVTENLDIFVLEQTIQGASELSRDEEQCCQRQPHGYMIRVLDGSRVSCFLDNYRRENDNDNKEDLEGSAQDFSCPMSPNTIDEANHADGSGGSGSTCEVLGVRNDDFSSTLLFKTQSTERFLKQIGSHISLLDAEELFAVSLHAKGQASEVPVDMCVLPDYTIVIALRRMVPLHDGLAASRAEGVVRAFPGVRVRSDIFRGVQMKTSDRCRPTVSYEPEDQYVIAEGLPVITGVAASTGGVLYLSLCGSERSGNVIAIGSLMAQPNPACALQKNASWKNESSKEIEFEESTSQGSCWQRDPNCGSRNTIKFLVPIMSGFAAALSVDNSNNL